MREFRDLFVVADLFVVGLALDVVGAYVLARGLLASESVLALRAGTYWNGNPHAAIAVAEDQVDGRFGVRYLMAGFVLQAIGYAIDLSTSDSGDADVGQAAVAIAMALIAAGAAYLYWQRKRPGRVKATLIEMAHWDTENAWEPPKRRELPYEGRLWSWGQGVYSPSRYGETGEMYAKRVFDVDRVLPRSSGDPAEAEDGSERMSD